MATEKRLIDANEFHGVLEEIRQDYLEGNTFSDTFAAEVIKMAQDILAQASTVDAVEVVRCKDCKCRYGTPGQPNILCYQMKDDDFCSYGERRDNGKTD